MGNQFCGITFGTGPVKSFYFADTIYKFIKNTKKVNINSIENSVDPDQLPSSEAS